MKNQDEQQDSQTIAESLERILLGMTTIEAVIRDRPDLAKSIIGEYEAAMWLLSRQSQVDPPEGFVPASKARLMRRIQNESALTAGRSVSIGSVPVKSSYNYRKTSKSLPAATLKQPARRPTYLFAATLALILVLIFGSTGTVYASQGSLPGEPLYPVKLFSQNVQMVFAFTEEQKAVLELKFTQEQLNDIEQLINQGKAEQAMPALAAYRQDIAEAVRLARQALEGHDKAQLAGMVGEMESALNQQGNQLDKIINNMPDDAPGQLKKELETTRGASDLAKGRLDGNEPQQNSPQMSQPDETVTSSPVPVEGNTEATATPKGNKQGDQPVDANQNTSSGKGQPGVAPEKVTHTPNTPQSGNQAKTPEPQPNQNSGGGKKTAEPDSPNK